MYLLSAVILMLDVLQLDAYITAVYYGTFVLVFYLYVHITQRGFDGKDLLVPVIIVAALFSVLMNAVFDSTYGISFVYFKKVIIFSTTVLLLSITGKVSADKGIRKYLVAVYTVLSLLLVALYFVFGNALYSHDGIQTVFLYFNFTNPNLAGLFLAVFAMQQFVEVFGQKGLVRRALHMVLAGFMMYFVFKTQSRTALLILAVFILFCFCINRKRYVRCSFSPVTTAILVLIPIVFILFYFLVLDSEFVNSLMQTLSLVSEGKQLDSRYHVWKEGLEMFLQSPLFGAYYQISYGTGTSQMHNTHLDILCSYGIATFLMVLVFLHRLIYNGGREYASRKQFAYMVAFAFVILLGMGEATLFAGGLGFYLLAGGLVLIANSEVPEEVVEEEMEMGMEARGSVV